MAELIKPVDAEQAIIDELSPIYTISTSIPDNPPATFLRVIMVGGAERDLVTDSPLVTLEAFGVRESLAWAALVDAIARLSLAGRQGKLGNEVCYGVQIASLPQNYPMPTMPTHHRYISTIAPALRRRVTTL